jgi:hypothetical protein
VKLARWGKWALRILAMALAVAVGAFLVGRAVVVAVHDVPTRPATYRNDWGGPHYAGVMLVHVGPGVLVLLLTSWWLMRHRSRKSAFIDGTRRPGTVDPTSSDPATTNPATTNPARRMTRR